MSPRAVAALALVFSGLTALVYQILWVRWLGFVFGTSSEAIGTVLAVFFGGLAIGNALAARVAHRVERPLAVYAWLEIGIGAYAVATLPVLTRLDAIYAWIGPDWSGAPLVAMRLAASALLLLPPTIAMGATLPVVMRGLVDDDRSLGRWTGLLYGANTLGSVLGAYLCGFWFVPYLGLTQAAIAAAAVNIAVGAGVLLRLGKRRVAAAGAAPGAVGAPGSRIFLAFFACSGFVAIGYEMVWSKLFGIVMEGTLYGFATVLSTYLLGIGLGSVAIASRVDQIVDLRRAFAGLHVAIAGAVAAGLSIVPSLPYWQGRLAEWVGLLDPTHALYLLAAPLILVPATLFGMAFPVLMRLYSPRSESVAQGVGTAVAVNTAGSIVASLAIGFWANPTLGMDATLAGLLVIDLAVAVAALAVGAGAFAASRRPAWIATIAVVAMVGMSYGGVQVDRVIAGHAVRSGDWSQYRAAMRARVDRQLLLLEGKNAVVTVSASEHGREMKTNGMAEAGVAFARPNLPSTVTLLGLVPYLLAPQPESALVVGLGGGNTVEALRQTALTRIDVVELEGRVVDAVDVLHEGRPHPLDDPRVTLLVDDGRHELLRSRHRGAPVLDLVVSQPSHPWIMGAANLFTEDFFTLAHDALRPGGVCAIWVNGFKTTPDATIAIAASFDAVFPGSLLVDVSPAFDRTSLLLVGARGGLVLDPAGIAERMAEADVATTLREHGIERVEELFARFETPSAALVALEPSLRNTDDNAYVETTIPRSAGIGALDYAAIEARLAPDAPLWPPRVSVDLGAVAAAFVRASEVHGAPVGRKFERLVAAHGAGVEPYRLAVLAAQARLLSPETAPTALAVLRELADREPARAEAIRAAARHLAVRERAYAAAGTAFEAAFARSGDPQDAYDAARAWSSIDPARAWRLAQPLPEDDPRFPRRALFAAEVLLGEARASDAQLRAASDALLSYRESDEGRRFPGVNEALARLADRLGEEGAALAFRDAAHRDRQRRAAAWLDAAATALARGARSEAARALDEARPLVPGDPRLLALEARHAALAGESAAFDAALERIEQWSPSVAEGQSRVRRLRLAVDATDGAPGAAGGSR